MAPRGLSLTSNGAVNISQHIEIPTRRNVSVSYSDVEFVWQRLIDLTIF